MRRLLALAAAVAMVAVALFLRDRLDDDGRGEGGSSERGALVLVCATELADACDAVAAENVEVRVEPAGVTADALVAGSVELDGWATIAPWPRMVAEARQRAGRPEVLAETDPAPLARTPAVLVGVTERVASLSQACRVVEPSWRCIGEVVGEGIVAPAHDPADRSATGLLVLASAVTDFFGEVPTSSNDFQDPAFQSWFTRLERSTTFRTNFDSLVEHLLVRPSTFNVVGALEAPALALGAAGRDGYTILYPSPMATADAVLVWAAGTDDDRLGDALGEALRASGWRAGDDPEVPPTNGLPPAGVLEALRSLWRDVAR